MKQVIDIETIELRWSDWHKFETLKLHPKKSDVKVPKESGVYEVKCAGEQIRLTIGKAKNINDRVRNGLIKQSIQHSAGKKIKSSFSEGEHDTILVRWALTIRPAATEEELHRLYKNAFGKLPTYTSWT